jgi:hypothetical protein
MSLPAGLPALAVELCPMAYARYSDLKLANPMRKPTKNPAVNAEIIIE